VEQTRQRRYVVLAEGEFGEAGSKTAMGVIRYGSDPVIAVIDSSRAGSNVSDWMGASFDIPVVASLEEALPFRPTALLLGTAPAGGRIPAAWRRIVLTAIDSGLDVAAGLHEFLSDDAEFREAAERRGVTLVDYRRLPEGIGVARGREHRPGTRVILTVGTDCAVGKMTAALELRRAAVEAGLPGVFVATGQTGIMIEGWGISVDRVISDFVAGAAEGLVEQAESLGDWIFIEGQGSLDHPAYSPVTLGLIHGATPDGMVLVHEPGRTLRHGWEDRPGFAATLKPLDATIRAYEAVASLVAPSQVLAIALHTGRLREAEARAVIDQVNDETGLVTDDPVRFGAGRLLNALLDGLGDPRPPLGVPRVSG
jgi:uncharacterized NAD-dependent epimerase/dehydratase family protein